MSDEKPKYAERAERLREFYESRNFKSKVAFAESLGIKKQNVNAYLTGTQDPVNLCEELIELGCDINWLITGKRFDESKTGITNEDVHMLIELRVHGIETVSDLKAMIQRDELLKKAFTPAPRNPLYTEQEQEYYLDRPEHKTKSAIKKQKKQEHHKS